ncbi:hypothetical protein UlMin_026047 [Ulmus minor]
MSAEEAWTPATIDLESQQSGFDRTTGIFHSVHYLDKNHKIPTEPNLDTATFLLSQFPHSYLAESRVALVDSATNERVTYAQLRRSILSLANGLYHALGIRKGDVVLVLSPNSLLYPTICIAILSVGAILTTANPLNTESELAKQVSDSGAKLAISAPEELHKLIPTGIPTIPTTENNNSLTIQELITCCEPKELEHSIQTRPTQSDTAAILYSSGTTGTSKGVVLTHSNVISVMTLLKWCVESSSSRDDTFLCFIPMFHIYGLAFFGLGLFCSGNRVVVMKKFDKQAMLDAIEHHKVNNIPAVPPVILGLVKHAGKCDLSSLRRVGSGAAPLSNEMVDAFRHKFPWVEFRPGYGLTESCGAATFFVSDKQAKARSASCGLLLPGFCAKIVDVETGEALPPYKEGELWLKSATLGTIEQGWLKTGDLCYFDGDGLLYVVDRIKELIKHNGYQVAPAELEAILLGHPNILDTAVIPVEDEAVGEIPMAYVVRAAGYELTEDQVIDYVASQVAPYKKVRKVGFINAIPRSAAGKILRKELILQTKNHHITSRL